MGNPANPVNVGTIPTPILSDPARSVGLWLPEDATRDVTITVTWDNGSTETTVLAPGGPGLEFEGPPPSRAIARITGTVASGSQYVYRAVLQP